LIAGEGHGVENYVPQFRRMLSRMALRGQILMGDGMLAMTIFV